MSKRNVTPRFCFLCGDKLLEAGLGFLQCDGCSEMFFPYLNEDNEQALALCNPD